MRLRDFYYAAKPLIPRALQIALRRQLALRKRKQCADVWPILEAAGEPPEGWKGWPEGKRFALVLTHDVDTAKGHENCLELAELEESYGFRSSFNFVPERYKVSSELRHELLRRGFEVGIHGLVHDGKLFSSRKLFEERAEKINKYLQEWECSGFRAPAMHHNLEWLCELDVQYDASTFDTDPFEPQSEGVGTIFPFPVYRNSGQVRKTEDSRLRQGYAGPRKTVDSRESSRSRQEPSTQDSTASINSTNSSNPIDPKNSRPFYVELPYTLPQDHCLFVILNEKDIRIWKEKLDWIAEKGGMVLLNSHPDYMNLENGYCGVEEYPVRHYTEFLEYVKNKYEGLFWHALARDVAGFWCMKMEHHRTGPL